MNKEGILGLVFCLGILLIWWVAYQDGRSETISQYSKCMNLNPNDFTKMPYCFH